MKSYFPTPIAVTDERTVSSKMLDFSNSCVSVDLGISIRAKFAESAMQAIIITYGIDFRTKESVAKKAIEYADELIKQLEL